MACAPVAKANLVVSVTLFVVAAAVGRLLSDEALCLPMVRNAASMREAYSLTRWTGTLDSVLEEAGLLRRPRSA